MTALLLFLFSFEIEDPTSKAIEADYLVVCPAEFAKAIELLLEYRSKLGHKPGLVTTETIAKHWKGLREFVRYAAKEWKLPPRFLLIVGDADRIPTIQKRSEYQTTKYANDEELGTDHLYGVLDDGYDASIAVGRFPVDTKEEVEAIVAKTIEYERDLKAGVWQKRINFVTGEAGFSPIIDPLIEVQFTSIVSDNIPAPFDIEVAYSKTTSRYCPYPPKFNENAVRLLNEGSLFYVYVGHGHRTGFDSLEWKGKDLPIFDVANLKDVDVRSGLPIMFVLACSTGFFDARSGDCIGEELLKLRKGPVAFVGGSRITQPYISAILGKELVTEIFHHRCETLGWGMVEAKKRAMADDRSRLRITADTMAAAVQGKDNLVPMRKDGVLHYNLLGDPALRIRRPDDHVEISTSKTVASGADLAIRGTSPLKTGRVRLSFECLRTKFAQPLPRVVLGATDFEEKIAERYQKANDKVIVWIEVAVAEGKFEAKLPLPHDLEEGDYVLKAAVSTDDGFATGSASVHCMGERDE